MKYTFLFIAAFLFCLPSPADARSNRVSQFPHGSAFGCDACHTSAGGLTDFGFDSYTYTTNGNMTWKSLAAKDSDGDGYSNGVELGDPNGNWTTGSATPGGNYTDPNDADDNFCGDGTMQANEECEGSNLEGASCGSLGLGDGNLTCTNRCVYNVAVCGGCGNNVQQNNEECDGTDRAGASCEVLGFDGGTISCGADCRLITSACTGQQQAGALCGNLSRDVGESCDGSDVGTTTCQTLGYTGGFLGCSTQCTFDVGGCTTFAGTPAPAPTGTPANPDNGLSPSTPSDAVDPIVFEGRACSAVGADPSLGLLFILGLLWRRRRS